jgi:ATP-dependent Clp protease ATP-binding subunit ClpA
MNGYNFTDRVRKVLQIAREEALRLSHEYVGTEHILLAVILEGEGVAMAVLTNLNVDTEEMSREVEAAIKKGGAAPSGDLQLPYTSRAKKVLELAMSEARELNHSYVGSEHLLLGLLGEEKGIAAQVLNGAGVTLELARAEVLRLLGSEAPALSATGPVFPELAYALGPGANTVLILARDTASVFRHDAIDTEHLLNALIREDDEAVSVLRSLGVSIDRIADLLDEVRKVPGRGKRLDIPYSKNARRAIWLAVAEALSLGDDSVASSHLLLGLLRVPGVAGELLAGLGVTETLVREQLRRNH